MQDVINAVFLVVRLEVGEARAFVDPRDAMHVIPAQPSPTSDGHMYSNATLILPHIQSPAWNRGLAWNLVLWQMPRVKL